MSLKYRNHQIFNGIRETHGLNNPVVVSISQDVFRHIMVDTLKTQINLREG